MINNIHSILNVTLLISTFILINIILKTFKKNELFQNSNDDNNLISSIKNIQDFTENLLTCNYEKYSEDIDNKYKKLFECNESTLRLNNVEFADDYNLSLSSGGEGYAVPLNTIISFALTYDNIPKNPFWDLKVIKTNEKYIIPPFPNTTLLTDYHIQNKTYPATECWYPCIGGNISLNNNNKNIPDLMDKYLLNATKDKYIDIDIGNTINESGKLPEPPNHTHKYKKPNYGLSDSQKYDVSIQSSGKFYPVTGIKATSTLYKPDKNNTNSPDEKWCSENTIPSIKMSFWIRIN